MPFRFVYRTDDISVLLYRRNVDSAEISVVRYTNVNGIVAEEALSPLTRILSSSKKVVVRGGSWDWAMGIDQNLASSLKGIKENPGDCAVGYRSGMYKVTYPPSKKKEGKGKDWGGSKNPIIL